MGIGSRKQFNFGLLNENPVDVYIKHVHLNMSQTSVGIIAVENGNASTAMLAVVSEYENTPVQVSDICKNISLSFQVLLIVCRIISYSFKLYIDIFYIILISYLFFNLV